MSEISRRKFFVLSALSASVLALGIPSRSDGYTAGIIKTAAATEHGIELNSWVIIDPDGQVTLVTHRAEMGQGVYQSLPQILAEELEVNLDDVQVVFAPGDTNKYGSQVTGGSSSVRLNYKNLLKLGASAREMLITAAARQWDVKREDCYAESGQVIHRPSGNRGHYGRFVDAAARLEPPREVKSKNISEYRLIRQPLKRLDTPAKIRGRAEFGIDKRLDGMLFAAVERCPRLHGKVKNFDADAAMRVSGVVRVLPVRMGVHRTYREGVAVVANTTWAALQGRKALRVEWNDSEFEHINSEDIYRRQRELLQKEEGLVLRANGEPSAKIKAATAKMDVMYQTPYQAHSCMEPLNCTAHYHDGRLEIWGPIQAPEWVQDYISQEMQIPHANITVNLTFLGGGFGRKAFMDYPHEAALLSKALGAPVQVLWTREDDTSQGPWRPGISYRCEGVIQEGRIAALKFRLAGQNNDHWRGGDAKRGIPNRSTAEGFLNPYFESLEHISVADVPFESTPTTMWWRSVYASTNGFAYESFMDELAHAAGDDPLEFRHKHLQDKRLHELIARLAAVSGWKTRGKGFGAAITECFGSTVGQVVQVSKRSSGGVGIDKVWAVIDCGWFVNPDTIAAQVEGSILMALGAATMHQITFKEGRAEQHNFDTYPMPRMPDMPPVEVHIMDNDADAGGVGEPGLPAFAPALANAIFDLTGERIRKLPINLQQLTSA